MSDLYMKDGSLVTDEVRYKLVTEHLNLQSKLKINIEDTPIDSIADRLGFESTPKYATIRQWRSKFGIKKTYRSPINKCETTKDMRTFVQAVVDFRSHNICTRNEAIFAVSEMLETKPITPSAYTYHRVQLGLRSKLPKINCSICNDLFEPETVSNSTCGRCVKDIGVRTSSRIARKPELLELQKVHQCYCGKHFMRTSRGLKWCSSCIKSIPLEHRNNIAKSIIHVCTGCGRLKYPASGSRKPNGTSVGYCNICLTHDEYTRHNKSTRRKKLNKRVMCKCGNGIMVSVRGSGKNNSCARCIKLLKRKQRFNWTIAKSYTRCAYCYSKMGIDSESRFCKECLSKYLEDTLVKLCMTEEMKHEKEVERYNKEFMRKHTLMLNRVKTNKPKTKQSKDANYQEKIIDDMRDMAIIESLKSLIEE